MVTLATTLVFCNSASAIGPLYYASAPYVAPPLGGGGTLIAGSQFFAARFQVTQPLTIDGIGGNIVGAPSGGSIFGALVALSSMSDYPDSTSLTTPDVLAHVLFTPALPSTDPSAAA